MSYFGATNWYTEVKLGRVSGHSIVRVFGRNPTAGVALVDISTLGSVYTWPTAAVNLEAISSSVNDTNSSGSGARVITVTGLDTDFIEIEEDINMNGVSASSATSSAFRRIHTAYVKTSGTYASSSAGANAGTITIRTQSAGASHVTIAVTAPPKGVTQSARYTIPAAKTGYLIGARINVDSTKSASIICWERSDADDVTTPFSGKQLVFQLDGIARTVSYTPITPIGPFSAKTDLWWSSISAQTNTPISVDFEILVIDD